LVLAAALAAVWLVPAASASAVTTSTGSALPTNGTSTGVAMSGTTALVGEDPSLIGQSGPPRVAVFKQASGRWTQVASLSAPAGANLTNWGWDLALDTTATPPAAVVGGDGTEVDVYVQNRAGNWALQQQIAAPADESTAGDFANAGHNNCCANAYPQEVAVSGDTLAVGGPREAGDGGAVWLYTRANGSWSEATKLTVPQPGGFGRAVALTHGLLLAGAPYTATAGGGAAYVFASSGSGWAQQAMLSDTAGAVCKTANGTESLPYGLPSDCEFGASVGLDGRTAVIGEPNFPLTYNGVGCSADRCDEGQVWVFQGGGSPSSWQPDGSPLNSVGFPDSAFGVATSGLAISGNRIVAGSYNGAPDPATAYVWTKSNGTWSPSQELEAPASCHCALGTAVATNGSAEIADVLQSGTGVSDLNARAYP
jgi:hypothetical protein